MNDNSKLSERLTEVDREIGTVRAEVYGIKAEVHHLRDDIGKIAGSMKALQESVTARNTTDWKTLISAVALFVTVGTLALTPMFRDISSVKTDLKTHIAQDSHVGTRKDVMYLTKSVSNLDEVLQREMRLLDNSMKQEIDNLDVILQREMKQNDDLIKQTVKDIAQDTDRLSRWQDENDKRNRHLTGIMIEKLRALERAVFRERTKETTEIDKNEILFRK